MEKESDGNDLEDQIGQASRGQQVKVDKPIHYCGQCKELNKTEIAVSFCKNCKESLCKGCDEQHKVIKATKTHKLVDIDEIEEDANMYHDCGQCKAMNKTEKAVSFCKNCEEPLCEACDKQHRVIKATRQHVLADIAILDQERSPDRHCGQCKELNKAEKAVSFCKDCNEPLCDGCDRQHRVIKATKMHNVVDIDEVDEDTKYHHQCGQCKEIDLVKEAISFCKECKEPLCQDCDKQHRVFKPTKNHVLVGIDEIEKDRKYCHQCGQCKEMDVVKEALSFCKECKEPLCQDCDKLHRVFKPTKNHVLVGIDEIEKEQERSQLCSQCKGIGKSEVAVTFCNTCLETLCVECEKQHKRMKATMSHDLLHINEISQDVSISKQCDVCKTCDRSVSATSYCRDCEEALCEECTNRHRGQKFTRNHDLEDIDDALKISTPYELCTTCKEGGVNKRAISYCAVCDDVLCSTCIDDHKRVKATRKHILKELKYGMKDVSISKQCDVCKTCDRSVAATSYCRDCEEALCEECTNRHRGQKSTRNHGLKDIDDALKENDRRQEEDGLQDSLSLSKKYATKSHQEREQLVDNTKDTRKPSTPNVKFIQPDEVTIIWGPPSDLTGLAQYQVRFRSGNGKWKFHNTENTISECSIKRLRANTEYEFQVRGIFGDEEGPYSEVGVKVKTKESLGHKLVSFSALLKDSYPKIYQLFTTEDVQARNDEQKTRKVYLGKYVDDGGFVYSEKTIMLVGATGTGKSTLVDGLVNYVLGVSFDDPFRFSLVSLEKEEKAHMNNQAVSQTDWITVYSILPDEGSKLSYKLNIIDTPGFGDTRGIERDNKIVQQIKGLFSADGRKGVMLIDAVCFMTKAPDARLTATQKYVFSSIAALFGKDIIKNICTLITFADGKQPPVLAALNESKLPYGHWFPFNNSALQADNEGEGMSDLSPIFWEMGCKSFGKFFEQLNKFETKSLQMTKDVLQERHNLQSIIQNLKPQVDAGLSKLHEIRTELKILEQHKTDIESNKDFQYEVDETKQIQKELKIGQHVTNCLHCNMTCHDDCVYADDNDKARCSSMNKEGKCKICTSKCHWTMHKNVPYIFEYVTEKVKKTYKEKLKKYEEASGKKLNHETVVNKMAEELDYLQLVIQDMMNNVNRCNNRLKEIALHPDPLTMKDHIDLMIEGEKQEKRIGWEGRIKMLQNMRQNANIEMDVDQLSKEMELAKSQIESSTGKPSERKEGYISRKLAAFKNFFA